MTVSSVDSPRSPRRARSALPVLTTARRARRGHLGWLDCEPPVRGARSCPVLPRGLWAQEVSEQKSRPHAEPCPLPAPPETFWPPSTSSGATWQPLQAQ